MRLARNSDAVSRWVYARLRRMGPFRRTKAILTIGSIARFGERIEAATECAAELSTRRLGELRSTAGEIPRRHSIPTLPSTSRLSLKVLPFLVAVPCQIPKASLRSPLTFEYPRASNRDFASPSVKPFGGLIDRDTGGPDGSAGDSRFCPRAEPATKKLNIQIAIKDGARISVPFHERKEQRRLLFHWSPMTPIVQIVAMASFELAARRAPEAFARTPPEAVTPKGYSRRQTRGCLLRWPTAARLWPPRATTPVQSWAGSAIGRSPAPPSTRGWGSRTSGGNEHRGSDAEHRLAIYSKLHIIGPRESVSTRDMIRIVPLLLSGILAGCASASSPPLTSVDVVALCKELTQASVA